MIKITINDLINATAEVYSEYDTNKYLYRGSLSKSQSVNIAVNSYYSVWILAVPTSNNGYISMTGTADTYPPFSLDIDIRLVIVSCSILGFFAVVTTIALTIIYLKKK